jgi:hypothetical protein
MTTPERLGLAALSFGEFDLEGAGGGADLASWLLLTEGSGGTGTAEADSEFTSFLSSGLSPLIIFSLLKFTD